MTREEMLKKLGLTHEELKDYLKKFGQLHASLNEHQRAVLLQSLRSPSAAAQSFGPDVTAGQLEKLLDVGHQDGFAAAAVVAHQAPTP